MLLRFHMKKKILQFSHSFSDNRIPPQVVSNILNRVGMDTYIYYLFDNNVSNEQMTAYNQCESRSFNRTKHSRSNNKILNLFKLYRVLKNGQYDTIVTHRYKPFLLTLVLSRFFKDTQFCAIFHGNNSFKRLIRRLICRTLLHEKWTLIAVSESVKKDIMTTLGPTKANIKVIYNCLDMVETGLNQLPKDQARKQLGLDPHVFIFGCTARLVAGKGLHHLITAFSQLKTDKQVQLAIIGDGQEKDSLLKQAQQLGVENRVIFCGFREDAVRFATAFDTFVLPTTNEGFGLVLLEAAIAKIPLIASAVGGIPEVAAGTEIIQIPSHNTDALVNAMESILTLPVDERIQLGARTYQQLYKKFDISQIAPDYYQLLGIEPS